MMKADTNIINPNTGEIIAVPGDPLDDETLYRLEMIGLEVWADAAAHASRATHKDHLQPGVYVYWKDAFNGNGVEVSVFSGGPLEWYPSHRTYVPEGCGAI